MVIISNGIEVGLPTQPDSNELVDEPPIRIGGANETHSGIKAGPQNSLGIPLFGKDISKEAHVLDVEYITAQLGVDIK